MTLESRLREVVGRIDIAEKRAAAERNLAAVLRSGAVTTDDLVRLLENGAVPLTVREFICWALPRLEERLDATMLIRVLSSPEEILRAEAARSLAVLGDRSAVGPLVAALSQDPNIEVRKAAALALGNLHDGAALNALLSVLRRRSERADLRGVVAEALGELGQKDAIPHLMAALDDSSVEVRFWAVFALGQLGAEKALPQLRNMAKKDRGVLDGWGDVGKEAVQAIDEIERHGRA